MKYSNPVSTSVDLQLSAGADNPQQASAGASPKIKGTELFRRESLRIRNANKFVGLPVSDSCYDFELNFYFYMQLFY